MPNRNVESRFANVPSTYADRSIFKRPCTHKTSANIGECIPTYVDIVYPGDSVKMVTSKVCRLQTMLTPIMDNLYLDTYWFFVPLRLCWTHAKNFFGEATDQAWVPNVTYTTPTISSPSGGFATGTLADYMGLPVGVQWNATDENAPFVFPFRAYALIMNEFFRSTPLTDPLNIPIGDSNQTGTNGSSYINDVVNGGKPFVACKYHDYFTSALPSPQRAANPVSFPLISGSMAPVGATGTDIPNATTKFGKHSPQWKYISDSAAYPSAAGTKRAEYMVKDSQDDFYYMQMGSTDLTTALQSNGQLYVANLWADLSSTVGAVTVNQLRLAFQLQKYYEALARGGDRYQEIIRQLFNTESPDARLQRPEYLGGNRIPIQVHEVINQAQTANDYLGDLGATSRTADVHYDFERSFTEHGVLMCIQVVRYDHSYAQGLEKFWCRHTNEEWYVPTFASLGELPIWDSEIYADATTIGTRSVFGYQEAWSDLRYKPDRISGEMRPGIANTLASWHLSDYYSQLPTLSDGWIREDKSNVDRVLAVQSSVSNQYFMDIFFDGTYTRVLPLYSVPGLIDHH